MINPNNTRLNLSYTKFGIDFENKTFDSEFGTRISISKERQCLRLRHCLNCKSDTLKINDTGPFINLAPNTAFSNIDRPQSFRCKQISC